MTYISIDIYTVKELRKLIENGVINSSIVLRNDVVPYFEELRVIKGNLGLSECSIESLGSLEKIEGDFWISNHIVQPSLSRLGNLKIVDGNFSLRYSQVASLGQLEYVKGSLNLRDTKIEDLGSLQLVGGNLMLPKDARCRLPIDEIKVKGKITFWKDTEKSYQLETSEAKSTDYSSADVVEWPHRYIYSTKDLSYANKDQKRFYSEFKRKFYSAEYYNLNGNYNYAFLLFYEIKRDFHGSAQLDKYVELMTNLIQYYPKVASYAYEELINKFQLADRHEEAWEFIMQNDLTNIFNVLEYQYILERSLILEVGVLFYAKESVLTEFGRNNLESVIQSAHDKIKQYEEDSQDYFLNQFFPNKDLFEKLIEDKLEFKHPSILDLDYFRRFFDTEQEFELRNKEFAKNKSFSGFPSIILDSIEAECNRLLRSSEDDVRVSMGMPKIGEGWISETELYYFLSNAFPECRVIQHGSPEWLGRQHLDIYFPNENIAVEYQGGQHYKPVDFFGGQSSFEKTVERDARKKIKCEENDCILIYVDEGYNLEDVVNLIRNKIEGGAQQNL